jgi:hypothetical protein
LSLSKGALIVGSLLRRTTNAALMKRRNCTLPMTH